MGTARFWQLLASPQLLQVASIPHGTERPSSLDRELAVLSEEAPFLFILVIKERFAFHYLKEIIFEW